MRSSLTATMGGESVVIEWDRSVKQSAKEVEAYQRAGLVGVPVPGVRFAAEHVVVLVLAPGRPLSLMTRPQSGCVIDAADADAACGAARIARDWNVRASGVGYVTRFDVAKEFLDRYEVQQAGGQTIREYLTTPEGLGEFNENIVGRIEVVAEFR